MSEFLSKTITKTKTLHPGEVLEFAFNVPNPGKVQATSFAKWDKLIPIDPTKRQLELQSAGSTPKLVKKIDEGYSTLTFLSLDATTSNLGIWKVKVTNKENATEDFRLKVSYPGTIEVKTLTLPISIINTFINQTVKQISIRLTDGAGASYLKFPTSMGVPNSTFTLPKFRKKIYIPWSYTIKERVNDINSESVSANLENPIEGYINGSIKVNVKFETLGREIKGTVDGNVKNMNLEVRLGISVENRQITYQPSNIGVDFPISIDLVNVPGFLEDLLDWMTGFRNEIKSTVKNSVRKAFASASTKQAITNALNNQIKNVIGNNAKIVSAKVQSGNLIVKYYKI